MTAEKEETYLKKKIFPHQKIKHSYSHAQTHIQNMHN